MILSKNGVGILTLVLSLLGINISDNDILSFWSELMGVISFILMIWNQVKRPDITWFFFKKDE